MIIINNKWLYGICIACMFFISCSKSDEYFNSDFTTITIKVENTDNYLSNDDIEDFYFVKLETVEESLIGEIRRIRITNDRIFVLDSEVAKSLFVFDSEGKFLFKVGSIGQGPGEYVTINDFFLNEDKQSIAIFDANLRKINYYDWNGLYLHSKILSDFWFHACSPLSSEYYALDFTKRARGANKYHLQIIDNNKPIFKYKKLTNDYALSNNYHIAFYEGVDRLFYTPTLCDSLFIISSEGIEEAYSIDFGDKKMPSKTINKLTGSKQVEELYSSGYFYGIKDVTETNDFMYFSYSYLNSSLPFFYNKEKGIQHSGILYFPLPLTSYNDYFVGVYESHTIMAVLSADNNQEYLNNWQQIIGDDYWSFIQSHKDEENPLIVFYKIRNS
ncbi:hypothetical protein M2138_000894 [Dysgonomonadaceae bacterium PH5-43]|nr:hypothetical protein [Dysgonomonadaceae bacterium PH5-43]